MLTFAKIGLAIAVLGVALPAAAQTAPRYSKAVSYHDLDLSTADGREALDQRIDRAVNQVCGRESGVEAAMCKARARSSASSAMEIALAQPAGQNLAGRASRTAAIVGN